MTCGSGRLNKLAQQLDRQHAYRCARPPCCRHRAALSRGLAQDLPPTIQTRYGDVVVLTVLRLRQAALGPALDERAPLLAGAPSVCHAGIPHWVEHGAMFHRRHGAG
jgi:hypothetical protein